MAQSTSGRQAMGSTDELQASSPLANCRSSPRPVAQLASQQVDFILHHNTLTVDELLVAEVALKQLLDEGVLRRCAALLLRPRDQPVRVLRAAGDTLSGRRYATRAGTCAVQPCNANWPCGSSSASLPALSGR